MTLSPQFLDELRARTLLSGLIGKTVKIQRAGREWKACCPFHQEKTPSFTINDEKGFYHCFGCGAHGDAIRWMTDQRGLPFIDAVKELAQAAGLDVPAPDPKAQERAERASGLHDVTQAAQDWFVAQLDGIDGAEARAYLHKRGISDATRKTFGFGFAPDSRTKLKTALKHIDKAMLVEAGLLIEPPADEKPGKEPYDRFRGRLMIPIRDQRGRVIAFGGRILGSGEPKYLNSPDTPLFDKGRTLYNLDRASAAARKSGRVIVVEGYMDVIALAQAGIEEAVAPLGTALTENQIERLWRMSDAPILCFDGDNAGQKAAVRALGRALPHLEPGRTLRFVTLPQGQDPDDLVRAGGRAAVESLLEKPESLVDRLWSHELAALPLDTPEARAGLRKRLNDQAQTIKDGDVREQYRQEFRARFDELYERSRPPRQQQQSPRGGGRGGGKWMPPPRPLSEAARRISGEGINIHLARAIFGGLLAHPAAIEYCADSLSAIPLADPNLERLRSALIDAAFSRQALDPASLAPILADAGLDTLSKQLLSTKRLAFSSMRSNAERESAHRSIIMAIEALASVPELDAALAAVTLRLELEWDGALVEEQARLRAARREADERIASFASGDDGADS
ncbi:DNA primase [Sphingomonas colocasiae]|uniref:DNA primase n=1 Tax=Sphingomonas colocasiae TaxID=1848973 RepID=A0ABS7PHA1_9SPHN|nr:DNA primase [Sphingomonas colocasiae]MBY8820673.1 DNA primase [Sphingomonas colocasiae]